MNNAASYTPVTRTDLWCGREGTFYAINGARIDGTVYVGMTSHETQDYSGDRSVKVHAPSMWVDLSPSRADAHGGVSSEREPITVNGKVYDARFGARVEYLPAAADDHRAQYYPIAVVDGRRYLVSVRFDSWDGLTDSARKMIGDVLQAIAAEYVTDARWHAQRVSEATYARDRALEKVIGAEAELARLQAVLDAIESDR